MAEVVGYEVQVRRDDGPWETLKHFGAREQPLAKGVFERTRFENGATGIRLIEEWVDEQGLFRTRMLGLRSAPATVGPSGRPERRAPAAAATAPGGHAAAPSAARPVAAKLAEPKPAAGSPRQRATARQAKIAGSRFSFTDLLSFLFTPGREQAGGGQGPQATALQPPPEPVGRRGDLMVYADEVDKPTSDLLTADTLVREFNAFADALNSIESAEQAKTNPKFVQGISLFTIGVLFSIEEQLDIFSQRGKTVVHGCLNRFIELHQTIAHFVESLERYLREEQSASWIRAGSRCFRYYRDADMKNLNREFGETFGVYDRLEKLLGGKVKVGILFTDIVDSTALTGELGDSLAQEVIEHHDATVEGVARKFGGRKVKHLGDGLMLCFGSSQSMAGCAVAIVDAMKGFAERPDVPTYRLRCGGHFGEAIHRGDDFFGSTVQLAARVAAAAEPNEARFCAAIIEPDKPAFRRFEDCGAASLKGFDQPMVLARYR